ncbi:sulfurtransferase complex subunit TusC [Vibrio sp. SS-MA-C1-2]|uniref:sulfurtransferase complex subunit TusC n=1 Tax=Vibrio sp. SS-MA-C1-2 TaxID=2908646 RepID=UPI001F27EA53|nr:sulfurtransferase complex subunit TusC [Vibrio sp. SS-MA-C1-2]UJF19200.1 sulfurtransferase complex subunit TusC [Vibrio sp. SS-MA-C1-2]
MTTQIDVGFIFTSAPHGITSGREGLDAVLATSAYSENIGLLFLGDGIFQLLKQQDPEKILSRDYISLFKMLELYDVEQLYVCQQSLDERGIDQQDLLVDVMTCSIAEIALKLNSCKQLLRF